MIQVKTTGLRTFGLRCPADIARLRVRATILRMAAP